MELFGCKAEKIAKSNDAQTVTEMYIEAYKKSKNEGCTPVIITLNETLKQTIDDNCSMYDSPEKFTSQMLSADTSDGRSILDERYKQMQQVFEYSDDEDYDPSDLGDISSNQFTAWGVSAIIGNCENYILYVPTAKPWEVFAWLPFGGWNECPDAHEMMSVCRCWYESFGAVPAFITSDMLEFYIPSPVTNKEAAQELAKEHCLFCRDILDMGGVNCQAGSILNSKVWSFWWD
ncbi:MAG: DUF4253 domain-containing protein [Oscillospiraceae bacterium]|nr:DUF4253 domain-containing protein [Oscillospiraceae bacterium]